MGRPCRVGTAHHLFWLLSSSSEKFMQQPGKEECLFGEYILRNWWAVPTPHYLTQGQGAFTLQRWQI